MRRRRAVVRSQRKQGVTLQKITTCPDCGGRGGLIDSPCPECVGTGRVSREETLKVRISARRRGRHGAAHRRPWPARREAWGAARRSLCRHPSCRGFAVRAARQRSLPHRDHRRRRRGPWRERSTSSTLLAQNRRAIARRSTKRRRSRRRAAGHDPAPRREGIAELRRRPARRPLRPASVHVPERLTERQRGLYEQLRATNPHNPS